MKRHNVRLGGITILFAVIAICVATLSVLTVSTASADKRIAQRYADNITAYYELENMGNEFLAEHPNDTVTTTLTLDNRQLTISLENGKIVLWEQQTIREETDEYNLWQP